MAPEETVLVAEDDETVRAGLRTMLEDRAYRVLQAETKKEAVEAFRAHQGQIGIVFLDILLPDGSGLDIVGDLLDADRNAVILIITAYSQDEDYRRTASRKGVFDFIGKGLGWMEICGRRVKQASHYRKVLDLCEEAEERQRDLERVLSENMAIGAFFEGILQSLTLPFEAERVIAHLGPQFRGLAGISELPEEWLTELGKAEDADFGRLLECNPRIRWVSMHGRPREPVWLSDLDESEFPLADGSLLVPMAPANSPVGILEVPHPELHYCHLPILEHWRQVSDVSGVRLLSSLSQWLRLQSLDFCVHRLAHVSRELAGFATQITDEAASDAFEGKLDDLDGEVNSLRVKRALMSPLEPTDTRVYDANLVIFDVQHRQDGRLASANGVWQTEGMADDLPGVEVHVRKLCGAVENLVINAIEALEEAPTGKPEIGLESRRTDGGKSVEIVVWDNGPGMPSWVDDPFERPFTTKEPEAERGQGLQLVRSAIRRMNGTITYEPNQPAGCRFVIRLPAAEGNGRADQ